MDFIYLTLTKRDDPHVGINPKNDPLVGITLFFFFLRVKVVHALPAETKSQRGQRRRSAAGPPVRTMEEEHRRGS